MLSRLDAIRRRARAHPAAARAVALLRLLIGFAFLPAGVRKVLGQPFTDAANHGPFHDFLHAFHATGGFYRAVGVVQLVAALLLMTQHRAALGAALALPVMSAILAFCWSTAVYPTAIVVTLMVAGLCGLLVWELPAWRPLVAPAAGAVPAPPDPPEALDRPVWAAAGLAVAALYATACALEGGVYRPRGMDLGAPGFWLLGAIALVPLVAYAVERRRRPRRALTPSAS